MDIKLAGTLASKPCSADYFTGQVTIEQIAQPEGAQRVAAANVSFAPGARTAWHSGA